MSPRSSLAANAARIFWGVLALVLLVALLASVFVSRGSIGDAEAAAQARAVDWANTVLFDALTPPEVQAPILGPDYRELLITVQTGIRSDERTARVRIWNADGILVFSDDQRDEVGDVVATDDPQIDAALSGTTVSEPTQATVAPKSGLAGSDEKLFQTFVPLRLDKGVGISGVVQIDQRYAAVEAEATDVWQEVRLALVIALTIAVAGLLFSFRARPAPAAVEGGGAAAATRSDRRQLERVAKVEEQLRLMTERAEAAEATAAEAEASTAQAATRLRELEERATRAEERATQLEERASRAESARQESAQRPSVAEGVRRGVPGMRTVAAPAGGSELEDRLNAAVAAKEVTAGELEAARAELAKAGSELAAVREALATKEAEATAATTAVVERTAALETVLGEMRSAMAEVEARATAAETRASETEAARTELSAELDRARAGTSSAPVAAGDEDLEGFRQRVAELESARRNDIVELQRAQESLANTQSESIQARRRVKELEEQLARALAASAGDGPAAVPEVEEPSPSHASRLGNLVREREPSPEPTRPTPAPAEPAPAEEEVDESTLSLRERLTRAAAARHRPSAPGSDT
jgi:hypothetical protein